MEGGEREGETERNVTCIERERKMEGRKERRKEGGKERKKAIEPMGCGAGAAGVWSWLGYL